MLPDGTVTLWIEQLKEGDPAAAAKLWASYFRRMVRLARYQLHGSTGLVADEEDVALSAFDAFCRGAGCGRFPQVSDRDSLWNLLFAITRHKALDLLRRESRQKRGGGRPAPAPGWGGRPAPAQLGQLRDRTPPPDFALEAAEQLQWLLGQLGDSSLRTVALRRMEGYTTEEIAGQLGCVPRTVERKLQVIRRLWEEASSCHDGAVPCRDWEPPGIPA
jgi:RNA polymerase sigma factor (sigma-70 family)